MVRTPSADSEPPEPLSIEYFSLRVFAAGLLLLVLAVVWVVLAVVSLIEITAGVFLITLMVFLAFLTGGQGLWLLGTATRRRFSDQPILVIDHEGIQDHSLAPAAGRLRWEEIERIESVTSFSQLVLTITPTDPFTYLARQQPLTRVLMWFQLVLIGAPIPLNMNHLPTSRETLPAAIAQYYAIDTPTVDDR